MQDFGLNSSELEYLKEKLSEFPEIEKVVIFGSRAMGNYKSGSDVDMALFGAKVNIDTLSHLKGLLEDEGPLPYFFDLVHYETVDSTELKKHIDQYGRKL